VSFTPEILAKLMAAGIAVEEFTHGLRAADSCVVATRLAHHYGYRLLPIRKKTKIPCLKGWPSNASSGLGEILRWRESYGSDFSILTGIGGGIWALDIDGEQGVADLSRLCEEHGPLPRTVKVISGRPSGFHLWFATNQSSKDLRTTSKVFGSSIDVRGWGGQIVIPGSEHRSGARYQFAPGCAPDEVSIATLPYDWYTALPKRIEGALPVRSNAERGTIIRRRFRMLNSNGDKIGDGPGRGGFHRPIYLTALKLIRDAGTDVDAKVVLAVLKAIVLNAPISPDRDPCDIARYGSNCYLLEQIERARTWCVSQQGNRYV
jgi:hypothetical protein